MLVFNGSVCAPNSNISQHEVYRPAAISLSHRAKVTWLTTAACKRINSLLCCSQVLKHSSLSLLQLTLRKAVDTQGPLPCSNRAAYWLHAKDGSFTCSHSSFFLLPFSNKCLRREIHRATEIIVEAGKPRRSVTSVIRGRKTF